MSQQEKALWAIMSGANDRGIAFADLRGVLERLGFQCRIRGDHFIYTKDTQVGSEENLSAIKAISGDRPYTIKAYDGLNHLFQHAVTGKTEEYSKIEETITPHVLEDIIVWIKSL